MKTPDTVHDLPIGDYDYILKKEGYYDYTDTVTVSLGETSVIATLVPIPSSTPIPIIATLTIPVLAFLLATTGKVVPITTGLLGGNVVVVKVGSSK